MLIFMKTMGNNYGKNYGHGYIPPIFTNDMMIRLVEHFPFDPGRALGMIHFLGIDIRMDGSGEPDKGPMVMKYFRGVCMNTIITLW